MTFKEFAKEYERLCFGFRVEVNEGEMLAYYDILRGYHQEQMRISCAYIMQGYKFFPKIAEIIEEIHSIPPRTDINTMQLGSGDRMPTEEERQAYVKEIREKLAEAMK